MPFAWTNNILLLPHMQHHKESTTPLVYLQHCWGLSQHLIRPPNTHSAQVFTTVFWNKQRQPFLNLVSISLCPCPLCSVLLHQHPLPAENLLLSYETILSPRLPLTLGTASPHMFATLSVSPLSNPTLTQIFYKRGLWQSEAGLNSIINTYIQKHAAAVQNIKHGNRSMLQTANNLKWEW